MKQGERLQLMTSTGRRTVSKNPISKNMTYSKALQGPRLHSCLTAARIDRDADQGNLLHVIMSGNHRTSPQNTLPYRNTVRSTPEAVTHKGSPQKPSQVTSMVRCLFSEQQGTK